MKKVNLRRTITGIAAAAAMAFTAVAPTALNVSPIAPTAISASAETYGDFEYSVNGKCCIYRKTNKASPYGNYRW